MLGTFNLGEITSVKTGDDGTFRHDEADVTIVLEVAKSGQSVICILSDDTDVSALFVYWSKREDMQCKVQMERWDGLVLDIYATCADLCQKYLHSAVVIQLHTLTAKEMLVLL